MGERGGNSRGKGVVVLISKRIKINGKKRRMGYGMYLRGGILNLVWLCN